MQSTKCVTLKISALYFSPILVRVYIYYFFLLYFKCLHYVINAIFSDILFVLFSTIIPLGAKIVLK